MQLPWFARADARWSGWKAALLAQERPIWTWRAARVLRRRWWRA